MEYEYLNAKPHTEISASEFLICLTQAKLCFVTISKNNYRLCLIVSGREYCLQTKSCMMFRRCYAEIVRAGVPVCRGHEPARFIGTALVLGAVVLAGILFFQTMP